MDHRFSNSPDPPDGAPGLSTNKDSQESTTLQDALKPLPDTQADSQHQQPVSPQDRINAAPSQALLIRRPMQPSVEDLADGFSYGKPKEVKPGQYSDRKHTKPIDPIGKAPAVDTGVPQLSSGSPLNSLSVSKGPAVITAHQLMPACVPSPYQNELLQNQQPVQAFRRANLPMQLRPPQNDHPHVAILQASPAVRVTHDVPGNALLHQNKHLLPDQPLQAALKATIPVQAPFPHDSHSSYVPQEDHSMQDSQHPEVVHDSPAHSARECLVKKQYRFDDYMPAYRVANPQKQMPTPAASLENSRLSTVESRSPCRGVLCQKVAVGQNIQRHSVSPSSIQSLPQKTRTSLQNDVSVDSAQPPKQMPLNMVNRPLKQKHGYHQSSIENTPTERPRKEDAITWSRIVRSNSKVKRSPGSQVTSSARSSSSSVHGLHRGETPSKRRHLKSNVQNLLKEQFAVKFSVAAAEISSVLNSNLTPLMEEVNEHLTTIECLQSELKQQQNKISYYRKHDKETDDKLHELEGEHCQLLAEVQAKDKELQRTSSKISKLEEKCHQYKEYLNSAIAEQQKLYKATKAKCDGAVAQIKDEEKKRNALQEAERKNVEAAREKLNQLVNQTVNEYKHREREFQDKIEALNQKVQERDADMLRERETAQKMLQQNGSISHIQETLKTFEVQMREVVDKVDTVVISQHRQDDQSANDTNSKLDKIMHCLRMLDERTLPSSEITRQMQDMNTQTVTSILEKLEPVLTAQMETKASLIALTSEIARSVDDLYDELEDRQGVIEEYCNQQLSDREASIDILQNHVEQIGAELAHQNELLFDSEETLRARETTVDTLMLEIEALTQAQEQNAAHSEHLEQLRTECTKLKDDSIAQNALVSELRMKLQESTMQLTMEEQKHQQHIEELNKVLEQQVDEAKAVQAQAVETAQQQAMHNMNTFKADIERQLNSTLKERTTLQVELAAAHSKITQIEIEGSKMSEKINSMDMELQSSRADAAKDREQARLQNMEQHAAKEQQLKLVEDLKSQLGKTEARFKKLVENAKSYDRAAQVVVLNLKQWTHNYSTIKIMADDLRKSSKMNEVLKHFDVRFKPLVEMQLLHTAVSQYCHSQKEAAQLLSGRAVTQKISQELPALETATGDVVARIPRVIVRSPASIAASPQPPSVQIEQERRRLREQPKSILKATSYVRKSRGEQFASEAPSSYTSMNRGPYNRLIAGTSNGPTAAIGVVEPQKRKQDFGQDPESKRTNGHRTNSGFGFTSPPKQVARSDIKNVPRAPRETGGFRLGGVLKGVVNGVRHSSPVGLFKSWEDEPHDNVNMAYRRKRASANKDDGALSMFLSRRSDAAAARANEKSHQTHAHSQDAIARDHNQRLSGTNDESEI